MRAFLLCLILSGCAHPSRFPPNRPSESARPPEATADQTTAPIAAERSASQSSIQPPGTISRSELTVVLDQPPGLFLRKVDSEPRLSGGRFAGWRIRSFFPGDPRFAAIDLKPGDVILGVNGNTLERPDHFVEVWQALRHSTELTVELERAGERKTLHWKIVD